MGVVPRPPARAAPRDYVPEASLIRIELTFRNLLLLFGLLIVAWITYVVRDTVVLLGMALMLMATLHPLVKMAERRGLSHSWAVAAVMLSLVLVPVIIIAALSPLLISEVQSFAKSLPSLQEHLQKILRDQGLADRVNQAIDKANLQDRISSLAVVGVTQTVAIVAKTFAVIVIAGYLLSDSHRLQLILHEFVPRKSERHIEPLLEGMERVVGGYIRGQLLTSALFGVFGFVLCLVLGVPNPLLMGIVAAVGDIIPLFGVPLAMVITMIVAFSVSAFQPVGVLIGYIIYGQLESHLLVPKIYSRTVNMSPLLVIVATIIGGALYGIIGIFVGIPVAGALKVILDYVVADRVKGREASAAVMQSEPTDPIGAEETREEHGGTASPGGPLNGSATGSDEDSLPDGVPEPTFSPFETLPELDATEPEKVSGARYITLARAGAKRTEARQGALHVYRRLRQLPPKVALPPESEASLPIRSRAVARVSKDRPGPDQG